MSVSHSIKERTVAENSLIIPLQGLHGHITTVELRDESSVTWLVDNVDAFTNVRLSEVTYTDRWGKVSHLDNFFVTGSNVRYVHIADEINIIQSQLQKIHRVRNFGGKDRGRKEFPSRK
uniref:U7 snRNA-associated Sm-like protein LSm10 n=2 Tax=Pristiophorus japonicus TaxID=55135 RepID=UPI00398F02D2